MWVASPRVAISPLHRLWSSTYGKVGQNCVHNTVVQVPSLAAGLLAHTAGLVPGRGFWTGPHVNGSTVASVAAGTLTPRGKEEEVK